MRRSHPPDARMLRSSGTLFAYLADVPADELLYPHEVPMRYMAIAGVVGIWLATPAQAQTMLPFENMAQIVCVDRAVAIELLAVYEEEIDRGEELLADLEARGMCERTTFSGKPVADVYPSKTRHKGGLREGHVFEVDVTSGEVLNGRTRAYMLLYVMHDNEV